MLLGPESGSTVLLSLPAQLILVLVATATVVHEVIGVVVPPVPGHSSPPLGQHAQGLAVLLGGVWVAVVDSRLMTKVILLLIQLEFVFLLIVLVDRAIKSVNHQLPLHILSGPAWELLDLLGDLVGVEVSLELEETGGVEMRGMA
jgi:hypothetical protein